MRQVVLQHQVAFLLVEHQARLLLQSGPDININKHVNKQGKIKEREREREREREGVRERERERQQRLGKERRERRGRGEAQSRGESGEREGGEGKKAIYTNSRSTAPAAPY